MPHENTTRVTPVPIRNGVVALGGYGIQVSVDRRHLRVEDGVGRDRREGRFAKAPARLKRLLVIAQTGVVTLEALRWLNDVGAAFVQLDYDASILTASIGSLDDARLRRAQALIPSTEHAATIAKELLEAKLRAQQAVLNSFGLGGTDDLARAVAAAQGSEDLGAVLLAEAKGAEAYWNAWKGVTMEFARRDRAPAHWRTFGTRRSLLTLGPRNASNPINAMLNYLYALLETETRLALLGRGLDPGLGFFHADTANRQSLAADVMEPIRAHVDAHVLDLLRTRTFSAKDFCETREGGCRLSSSLTQQLSATMPTWAKFVAPCAESVARHVGQLAKSGLGAVHPVAISQRARVKVRMRAIAASSTPKPKATVPMSALHNACRDCGAALKVRKRIYCDRCLPDHREEQRGANASAFKAAGPAKIAAMRKAGYDPTNTPEAKRRRSETAMKQRRAVVAWHDDGSFDGVDFRRDILPGLQRLPVKLIAEAMGTSISHGSKVRSGYLVPHKRHWKELQSLIERQ